MLYLTQTNHLTDSIIKLWTKSLWCALTFDKRIRFRIQFMLTPVLANTLLKRSIDNSITEILKWNIWKSCRSLYVLSYWKNFFMTMTSQLQRLLLWVHVMYLYYHEDMLGCQFWWVHYKLDTCWNDSSFCKTFLIACQTVTMDVWHM